MYEKSTKNKIFIVQVNVPDGTCLVLSVHPPLSGENRKESLIQDLIRVIKLVIIIQHHQSVINPTKSQIKTILIIVKQIQPPNKFVIPKQM